MITDDKKETPKYVAEPKVDPKIADVKLVFSKKIDENTVVGETKPVENLSVPPQEKRI